MHICNSWQFSLQSSASSMGTTEAIIRLLIAISMRSTAVWTYYHFSRVEFPLVAKGERCLMTSSWNANEFLKLRFFMDWSWTAHGFFMSYATQSQINRLFLLVIPSFFSFVNPVLSFMPSHTSSSSPCPAPIDTLFLFQLGMPGRIWQLIPIWQGLACQCYRLQVCFF